MKRMGHEISKSIYAERVRAILTGTAGASTQFAFKKFDNLQ